MYRDLNGLVTDYDPIRFDGKHLLIDRRRKLETVASLGDVPVATTATVSVVESMDVEQQPPAPLSQPIKAPRVPVASPPGGTVVFGLFRHLAPERVARLSPSVEQLLDVIRCNCPALITDTERRSGQLKQALFAYTQRMIANTLARDERGARMRTCLQQLEELYLCWGLTPEKTVRLIEGGKNNHTHVDHYRALLDEVYRVSCNPATDTFYETCADTRPRGRQPRVVSNNPPHPLNQLKKDYINSLKSAPPVVFDESDGGFYLAHEATQPLSNAQLTVDYYPLFFKMLGVVNGCVPRATNHGWFTQRVRDAVRVLTPQQWPMHGLVQSLCNLQGVLERKRVCVKARPGKRYYCCYTGQELKDGEEVWLLRVLVLCPQRHHQWVKQGRPPTGSKADHPALLSSIRCYFMKTKVQGLCSLFTSHFDAEYKARFAEYYQQSQALTVLAQPGKPQPYVMQQLPPNRQYVFNSLWRLMHRLHHYISVNNLAPVLRDRVDTESYQAYRTRMDPLLGQLSVEWKELRYIVFTGLFGVNSLDELGPVMQLESERVSELVQQVMDAVLDWFDLTLDFTVAGSTTVATQHCEFALPLLGQGDEPPKQALQTVVRPQLHTTAPLLQALFHHSDRRRVARTNGAPSSEEKGVRLARLQRCLCTHPFLLLALHDTLYKRCGQLEPLELLDAVTLMSTLGLSMRK